MIIELGNESAPNGVDNRPKVTYLHVPEADNTGQGGFTHKPGKITVAEFKSHVAEAVMLNGGVTHLPDHEILLAATSAWSGQGAGKPTWVKVRSHEDLHGPVKDAQHPKGEDGKLLKPVPHSNDACADIEDFLREFWGCGEKPADVENTHWTRYGAPGVSGPQPPQATALYTNAGRVISNVNDGGGQVGSAATGSAATATTLTTGQTYTLNQWAGYRVYCMQTATGPIIWGNVISNTTGGVLTIDRWYSAATPGGAAPSAPSAGYYFILADGGMTSSWFIGLTTTNITPAAADTILSGEYTTASGGMLRKIAPYAQTSGVASRSITLTPVFTANSSDTFPSTFYAIGVFTSMTVGSSGWPTMKFETSLNASFTINISGDNATITETISGS
jgi:hypothetical protein